MQPENSSNNGMPRIELDLDRDMGPRRPIPVMAPPQSNWQSERVPVYSLEVNRIGSDTARKTAGAIYLLQALFFGLLCFMPFVQEDGSQWFCGVISIFYLAIGFSLLQAGGLIERMILLISYLRVGVHTILLLLALAGPGKALVGSACTLVSSIGLIVLLSGKSLSKPVYFIATGVVLVTSFIYK